MDLPALLSSVLAELWEFLRFRRFVSPGVLLVVYYTGAVGIPLIVGYTLYRMRSHTGSRFKALGQRLAETVEQVENGIGHVHQIRDEHTYWERLTRTRMRLGLVALAGFIALELGWRMLFEFLLAYFQMHDALLLMQGG